MKPLFYISLLLSLISAACEKKNKEELKDYTSVICSLHNERVYKREWIPVSLEYSDKYAEFLRSKDWLSIYPYSVPRGDEGAHSVDDTKQYFYHLVCDKCVDALNRSKSEFYHKKAQKTTNPIG